MIIKYKSIICDDTKYMRNIIKSGNRTIYHARLTEQEIKKWINKGFIVAIQNYGIVGEV